MTLRINSISESILFVDDTNVIISSRNFKDFCSVSNLVLSHMMKWFAANNLIPDIMKFITKNLSHSTLCIGCKEKHIEKALNIEFLGLQIHNHVTWKNHIEQMTSK